MSAIKHSEPSARTGPGGGTAVHWIGGRRMDSGERRESVNPATGEVISDTAECDPGHRRTRPRPVEAAGSRSTAAAAVVPRLEEKN